MSGVEQDPLFEYRRQQGERFNRLRAEQRENQQTTNAVEAVTPTHERNHAQYSLSDDAALAKRLQDEEYALVYANVGSAEEAQSESNDTQEPSVRPPMRTGYRERLIDEPRVISNFFTRRRFRNRDEESGDRSGSAVSNWCIRCLSSQHTRRLVVVGLGISLGFILVQSFLAGLQRHPSPAVEMHN